MFTIYCQVSYNEGKELAESLGALYIETSAKNGVAVEEAFKLLCEGILERMDNGEIEMQARTHGGNKIGEASKKWESIQ